MELKSMMFICNDYPPWSQGGGIASFTKCLAERLDNKNIRTCILGCGHGVNQTVCQSIGKIKIKQLTYWKTRRFHPWLNRLKLNYQIFNEKNRNNIQVMEAPEYLGWLWPFNLNIPTVIRFHSSSRLSIWEEISNGHRIMPNWAKFELHSIRNGRKFCAVSHFLKNRIREVIPGMSDKDIDVIPNNVDTSFFAPDPHIEYDSSCVVYVGRVSVEKGVPELLNAWRSVLRKKPEAKLRLLGRDSTATSGAGSFISELKNGFDNEMAESVQFLGDLDRESVKNHLLNASFCVFASHFEACPSAVLEAMACGKAVIVPNNTSFPELVTHNVNGLMWNQSQISTLTESIMLLFQGADFRKELGHNARKTVMKKYNVDYLLDKNIQLYKRTIDNI